MAGFGEGAAPTLARCLLRRRRVLIPWALSGAQRPPVTAPGNSSWPAPTGTGPRPGVRGAKPPAACLVPSGAGGHGPVRGPGQGPARYPPARDTFPSGAPARPHVATDGGAASGTGPAEGGGRREEGGGKCQVPVWACVFAEPKPGQGPDCQRHNGARAGAEGTLRPAGAVSGQLGRQSTASARAAAEAP